jgi:hexosaminidase
MNYLQTSKTGIFTRIIIGLFILPGTIGCQKKGPNKITGAELLPAPQEVEFKKGISINPEKFKTVYLYSAIDEDTRFAANLLRDKISHIFDYEVNVQVVDSYEDLSSPSVILGIASEDIGFSNFCSGLPSPQEGNAESYVLDIKKDLITISGGGDAGLFYGVQTLTQLLEEAKWENESLPGMTIQDWPELKERWVHYNYFFHLDRYEYIKESIIKLSKYKVNGIVFEFEDKFKYKSHPFISAPNSLTPEQVKELTLFAHDYHIDIVPLVQGFGHAGYLLKHEQLKHLREDQELYQSFCPLKEETYEFIFDLFRETIEATPGVKYFHVGADEVNIMGKCPLCKKKAEEIGELGIHLIWLNKVQDFMKEHGRTLVYWDDMPLKQAGIYKSTYNEADEKFDSVWAEGTAKLSGIVDKFPQDGVFNRWNYELGRDKGNIKILEWYKENNFSTMIATAVIGDYPLIPNYDWMPANIKSYVTLAAEKSVLGELCTAWGDDSGNHFEIFWLGFLASAEYAWSSKSPATLDQYWEKYIRRFFGPNTDGLVPAFHNLSDRVEFWDSALMEKGNKRRKGYQFISLPDIHNKPSEGSWTRHFQPLMESAEQEKQKNAQAVETLERNMGKVTSNAYNLEVFASMGRFMESYCDLVLAIGEIAAYCDKVTEAREKGQKEEEISHLKKMVTVADLAWEGYNASYEDLKKIWEVARHPKGGKGYMMNPQTIYLAGRTADLSYLILAEQQLDLPAYTRKLLQESGQY